VSSENFTVRWIGQVAVISLPAEIDISSAGQVRQELLLALDEGATTLIADMSGTTFCDSAVMNALVQVHQTASGQDARLLVAGSPDVRRMLAITGLDRLMDIYPTVARSLIGLLPDPPGSRMNTAITSG
jgi:anti-sigma B factor antagonist